MTTLNNSNDERSMFGIQDVNADNIDTTNLICDTLVITTSGTSPTLPFGTNTNNIATTAFVIQNQNVADLQEIYNNSVTQPLITLSNTKPFKIKGTAGDNEVIEILDENGVVKISLNKSGITTVNLPICSAIPTLNSELVNKLYVDDRTLQQAYNNSNLITLSNALILKGDNGLDIQNSAGVSKITATGLGDLSVDGTIVCGNLAGGVKIQAFDSSKTSVQIGYLNERVANAVHIGFGTGQYINNANLGTYNTSVGTFAGRYNAKKYSTNIGAYSGYQNSGEDCLNLGSYSNYDGANLDNTICLNGTGVAFNANQSAGFFVKPIRNNTPNNHALLSLNTDTNEIVYSNSYSPVFNNISANDITCSKLITQTIKASITNGNIDIYTNLVYNIVRPVITMCSFYATFVLKAYKYTLTSATTILLSAATSITLSAATSIILAAPYVKVTGPILAPQIIAGVYLMNGSGGSFYNYPLTVSCTLNRFNASNGSTSAVSTSANGNSALGNFSIVALNDTCDKFMVFPNYGVILTKQTPNSILTLLNYHNDTNQMQIVAPTSVNLGDTVEIYFNYEKIDFMP